MSTYELTISELKEFLGTDLPYVPYDHYINVTRLIRDTKYAPEHIENFHEKFGTEFFMWTKELDTKYESTNFYDNMTEPWQISIEIPLINNMATFPLEIIVSSGEQIILKQTQKLVVQKIEKEKIYTSGWSRIPQLRKAVLKNAKNIRLTHYALKRLEEMECN